MGVVWRGYKYSRACVYLGRVRQGCDRDNKPAAAFGARVRE